MSFEENRNEKQVNFNQVKGVVLHKNLGDKFSTVVIEVGHENKRKVAFIAKKQSFDELLKDVEIKDRVSIKFYLSSSFKHERWYTNANLLSVEKYSPDF